MQLFVNDLTVIDFSYLCNERGIVGDSWIVDVVLDGGLDEQSMVLDFGHVKKIIKKTIDDIVDHRLLVPSRADASIIKQHDDGKVSVNFTSDKGEIALLCPEQAFAIIDSIEINIDAVEVFLKKVLLKALPNNINNLSLTLRCETIDGAYYHYSHGLKKHTGNCQRVAHGHRSPIQIYQNGARKPELEASWAKRWQDIYLATEEDCVAVEQLNLSKQSNITNQSHYGICYDAPQGNFNLAIPKAVCEIINHDTTVELLAQYVANTLTKIQPNNSYKVVAFEGVGKGAISSS